MVTGATGSPSPVIVRWPPLTVSEKTPFQLWLPLTAIFSIASHVPAVPLSHGAVATTGEPEGALQR